MNPEEFGGMYDGGDKIPNTGTGDGDGGGDGTGEVKFAVPDTYANEGWAKDLKSYPEVWTKLAGSEKLIGQRDEGKISLLKENATSEETDAFYKAVGRPDSADAYKFDREGQSEEFKKFNSDEMDIAVKGIFHKYGLSSNQVLGIQKDYEAMLETEISKKFDEQGKYDTDFEEMTTKAFGNDKDTIIESSKVLLENFAPEGFGDHIKNLDNESLTVIAGVLNNVKKTYISEDAFAGLIKGSTGAGGGGTEQELRTEARNLMASKEWTDPFNPKNKEVREQVDEIYRKVGEME